MNIAYITTMKWGLTLFNYRDIEALTDKGHTVAVYPIRSGKGLYNPQEGWPVVRVVPLLLLLSVVRFLTQQWGLFARLLARAIITRSLVDFLIAIYFAEQMREQKIDLMYVSWGDHKLFVGYYCKLILGIPLNVCIHAYELYKNPNPRMFRESLAHCNRVITVSKYNEALLQEQYGVPASKIDVVYHIIDLETFRYEPKIKILIVGYFAEKKGHDILFKAIRQLNRADLEVWVVGDATLTVKAVDCRAMARELGVEKQVVFFGAQSGNALRALFRECDVVCVPSRTASDGDREGLPTVLAEAMAFGKPVVATHHTGIPEVLERIVVEENNVEQLAAALAQVCDSADLRRELGARNRVRAEQTFSPANNDRLEAILRQQLAPSENQESRRSKR